jgi:hypothetical protein
MGVIVAMCRARFSLDAPMNLVADLARVSVEKGLAALIAA